MIYEGVPIPVVDLAFLIDSRYARDCLHSRIILLTSQTRERKKLLLGVLAEQVTETINLHETEFTKNGLINKNLSFVDGVLTDNSGIIQNINVEALFKSLPILSP